MTATSKLPMAASKNGIPPHTTGLLRINLGAIRRNYRRLQKAAPASEVAAVVKANAYGLGIAPVASSLAQAGCSTFFVATLAEAVSLRDTLPEAAIYVLDGLLPETGPAFAKARLRPVLGSRDEIMEWVAFCKASNEKLPAAVHVDTGMTRLGLSLPDAHTAVDELERLGPGFDHTLLMTHFACADYASSPLNRRQVERFREISARLPHIKTSLANSAGIFLGAEFCGDLVRPGISLYGGRAGPFDAHGQEPVVSLYGRVAQVEWAKAGETVGYGAAQTLKRATRIATVTVGYADGFLRSASASDSREGPCAFAGEARLPMLGRISMDLTTFDATDAPEDAVVRGGFVELMGARQTVDDFAAFAGTIGYEVLTSLGRRFHRVYADE